MRICDTETNTAMNMSSQSDRSQLSGDIPACFNFISWHLHTIGHILGAHSIPHSQ